MAGTNYAVDPSWLEFSGRSILAPITNLYLTHYSGFRLTPFVLESEVGRIFFKRIYWKKPDSWSLHEKGPRSLDHTNRIQHELAGGLKLCGPNYEVFFRATAIYQVLFSHKILVF